MIKEDGTKCGEMSGFSAKRIMSLNPRLIEMIRKHCDVGQIEHTRFFMDKRFFWKDEKTIVLFKSLETKFFISPPPMKTTRWQEVTDRAMKEDSARWRRDLKEYHRYGGNPWHSPHYRDPRLRR